VQSIPLLLMVHILGVVIWVGGMFFAHACLRPVAARQLEAPARLTLWCAVFARFFPAVWMAVLLILSSGLARAALVGWDGMPVHWRLMATTGSAMAAIFAWVYFVPYRTLQTSVAAQEWKRGAGALAAIRKLVGINLVLGLLTIAVATAGRML
jgi:uncharacterized membrane protein